MVEIDVPSLSELSDSMTELEYWFTIAMYVAFGICVFIILLVLYRILCCGVCLAKGVYSPFGCMFRCCKRKDKDPLLPEGGEPLTRSSIRSSFV